MLFPISKAVTKLEGGDYPTLNHILECLFLMLGIWKKKNLPNLEYNLLLLFNRYFGIEHAEEKRNSLSGIPQIFGMTLSWLQYWVHLRKVFISLQNQQPQYFKKKKRKGHT